MMESKVFRSIQLFLIILFLLTGCGNKTQDIPKGTNQEPQTTMKNEAVSPKGNSEFKEDVPVENLEGVPLDLETMSAEEKEAFLTGAWDLFFPTPNQNWGHRFRESGIYRYVDNSSEALKQRYRFTDGEWRIEGNIIKIRILSYRISDKDPVEDVLGLDFPQDTKYITVPVEDDTWYTIGTLESIRTGIVKDGYQFPPRITLHPLRFDKVLEEEHFYYRDRP